ncbi:ribosomal protein S18 acetylase RimI-like enzyme, partial [Stakelama pacifica]
CSSLNLDRFIRPSPCRRPDSTYQWRKSRGSDHAPRRLAQCVTNLFDREAIAFTAIHATRRQLGISARFWVRLSHGWVRLWDNSMTIFGDSRIRAVRHIDLDSLHPLIERAFRGETSRASWSYEVALAEGERISRAALLAILADPRQCLLGAFADDAPIGCVRIAYEPETVCELSLLTVEPDRQTAGLGKRLITAAERVAIERFRAQWMEIAVIVQQPRLISFYQRRGFGFTGRTKPYPVALDRPLHFAIMRKRLQDRAT